MRPSISAHSRVPETLASAFHCALHREPRTDSLAQPQRPQKPSPSHAPATQNNLPFFVLLSDFAALRYLKVTKGILSQKRALRAAFYLIKHNCFVSRFLPLIAAFPAVWPSSFPLLPVPARYTTHLTPTALRPTFNRFRPARRNHTA